MRQSAGLTRQAVDATLHCLTGCAIGEVVGMGIATWLGWSNLPSIALAIALAFLFGYALTAQSVLRAGLGLRTAIGVAFAADTVSIAIMEAVDNGFVLAVPGAMEAGLADWLFWSSLAVGFAIAFVLTVPVNRAMIARGKGHAVAHAYHGTGNGHSGNDGHSGHEGHSRDDGHGDRNARAGHGGREGRDRSGSGSAERH